MLKLLVDPRFRGATYDDALAVAETELRACTPVTEVHVESHPTLTFLQTDLDRTHAAAASRLSFVQGVFAGTGDTLQLIQTDPEYPLPEALVWGAKYRGKTHELVTQHALNVALSHCTASQDHAWRVLDPMAGRGTTLLWAARYGLSSWGIELDPGALDHVQRDVKRTTKVQRIKHTFRRGHAGRKRKDGVGRMIEFDFAGTTLQLISGDSRDAPALVGAGRFAILVTDTPYGVQHVGRKGTRSPLSVLSRCAQAWAECLLSGGVMAIVYNRIIVERDALVHVFASSGLEVLPFEAPHRVGESIWRDTLVLRRGF